MSLKHFLFYLILYAGMVTVFHYGTSLASDRHADARGAPIEIVPSHYTDDAEGRSDKKPCDQAGKPSMKNCPLSEVSLKPDEGALPPETAHPLPGLDGYKLGAGDKLKITVYEEEALSQTYAISDKGVISMPLIGDVFVGGARVEDVRQMITDKLAAGFLKNPDVSIEVSEYRPVYVMGEVRNPGSYAYVADMTILNAVVIAGGYTYRADQDDHEVMREEDGKSTVYKDEPESMKVRPGDIILVKERFF